MKNKIFFALFISSKWRYEDVRFSALDNSIESSLQKFDTKVVKESITERTSDGTAYRGFSRLRWTEERYMESQWMCFVFLPKSMTPNTRGRFSPLHALWVHRNSSTTPRDAGEMARTGDAFRVYCTHASSRSWMVIRVENEWIARSDVPWHRDIRTKTCHQSSSIVIICVASSFYRKKVSKYTGENCVEKSFKSVNVLCPKWKSILQQIALRKYDVAFLYW